jgi:hypothetical protein
MGAFAVLFLVYTLVGFFVVPRIIRSQIVDSARESLHREASVGDVRFNPFTLAATVTGLRLVDRDGADLVTVDRVHVNADTFGVFRWALRFSEILIEKPVVSARILRDGKPSVADLMEGGTSTEPFEMPRLIVDRLLMTSGVVRFTDASRQPAYDSRFEPLNLDITHLITLPQEGGEHAVTIGIGRNAQLRWNGRQTVEPLRFTGQLDITGLELHELWGYFAAKGPLDLREGQADLVLPYEIRRARSTPLEVNLTGASARVKSVAVRPWDGTTDWLTVAEARVDGVNVAWPAAHADVTSIKVSQPQALAQVEEDGRLNWQRIAGDAPPAPSPQGSWTYRIGSVEVERGGVRVENTAAPDAPPIELADVALTVRSVTQNLAVPLAFTSKARVQDAGSIEASGTVAPSPLALDVMFAAKEIALLPFQPYFVLPAATHITSGSLAMKGQASMPAGGGPLKLSADGSLDAIELQVQDERLVAWKRMAIEGFTFDDPPNRARIRTVTLDEAYAKVLIDKQGYLNLSRLADGRPAEGAKAPASEMGSERRKAPTLEVGNVVFRNARADFTDESLPLGAFNAQIHSANGTIRDLSTFAAAPSTAAIEGLVDKTGHVKVDGTLRAADPLAASEVTVSFRSIEMAGLSPYFAQFAGYRVRRGELDLDVRYQIQSRRLIGNHTIVAHDLVLGDRVKDSKGPGFAIRLAVALLKDRQGRINIEVPIQGTVDDPEFGYRQVFWSAVKTILGNAAKAPFRALGRLFGRDEEDLELVEFDAGRSDLLPADVEMLTKLGEQLAERDGLSLEIEGRYDATADPPAMKRARLEALIESRRAAATTAAAGGSSVLETILEGLFTEQFSADALLAERQRFTSPTAGAVAAAGSGSADASPPAAVAPAASASPALSATAAAAAVQGFDASGFYESLRQKLLEAQPVTPADLTALGAARAVSIVAVVSKGGTVAASRIKNAEPAAVRRSKKGSSRIASEMKMSGGDETEE